MFQSNSPLIGLNEGTNQTSSRCHSDQSQPLTQSLTSLKDELLSLTHRLSSLESTMPSKMDRQECLMLIQRKVSAGYLKRVLQEVRMGFLEEKRKDDERERQLREDKDKSIRVLIQKLTKDKDKGLNPDSIGNFTLNSRKDKKKNPPKTLSAITLLKPQQLYLQSNETMFSMLVQEVSSLKDQQIQLERLLEGRHRSGISLNNQVCKKLEKMEQQIEEIGKEVRKPKKDKERGNCGGSWNLSEMVGQKKSPSNHRQINVNNLNNNDLLASSQSVHVSSPQLYPSLTNFESLKLQNLSKSLQCFQKDLVNKMNLKDLLPLIKKNLSPVNQELQSMKSYIEESLQSMRKILMHQSEINEELCGALKVGWWKSCVQRIAYHSNDKGNVSRGARNLNLNLGNSPTNLNSSGQQNQDGPLQLVNWDKQLINMYPQGFISKKNDGWVTIGQQGTYLVAIYEDNYLDQSGSKTTAILVVDEEKVRIDGQKVVRLSKNAKVSVIALSGGEVYLMMQKL